MSSTEIAVSPTKKVSTKKMEQIVSSGVTNGCNLMDNIECSNGDNDDESVNQQTLITNLSETNKDYHVDACMEPLLIQNCVDEFSINPINEPNCVFSDENHVDLIDINETQQQVDIVEESPTDQGDNGGGGFIKSNMSLNLNDILNDDKIMPKNKKFLESSDDQIINQIFFSTITVTPTTDDDVLDSKFVSDNTPLTPTEVDDPETLVGPVDFFNRKIDEDETFDTTFTDTADNYQENDGNLCSLNDNFNENYCSFSSIDYNTNGQQEQQLDEESPENPNELLQPDNFLGDYAEQMRQQRPSIVIECYDSDSNSDKNSKTDEIAFGEQKINDYCFYFDQTIEEDDNDDACYLAGVGESLEDNNSNENDFFEGETDNYATKEVLDEEDIDECFDTEEEIFNEEAEEEETPNECDDDKSLASEDDEGVINESCLSVNSAVESLESETTVVKKSVKKSVKTSKTTSKKKTISTTESSSITSSKAESFENSFSNGSIEVVEQHHVQEHQAVHQESVTSSKSIDSSSGKEVIEAIQESAEKPSLENGEKKKLNGKKKIKKSKKSDEKENISVTASVTLSLPGSVKVNHTQNSIHNVVIDDVKTIDDTDCGKADVANNNLANRKFIMSSSLQLHEDDLSRIDVKSLKQKYSNAIEKQSTKSSAVGMNGSGYLGISKDFSVKNLCRSYGDLTSLNSEEYNSNHFQHVYRDSYCSLIGSNNTHHQQQPNSLMLHKRSNNTIKTSHKTKAIKLGIKQFDMRSSFSKFDALQKKNMQNLQNGRGESNGQNPELEKKCHACTKVVFQMEQVKAEKKFWHKNCFRCSECSKQLNVDTYQSHEGILYCKPHFKSLFAPKAVEESKEVKPRKLEMIIRESQPMELPPDVVRSSDKADLGLEELQQLNVRQRFQVFENAGQQETKHELDKSGSVKRSTSILSKLARFQAKGMDVGVVDDSLNGICYEHSSSEEEEEYDDDENQEDIELIRAKRAQKEKPMSFKEMHDIKSKFESGQLQQKEERREERKQELQNIRSRLFMGKQAKIKEMYQQAVAESEQTITASGKKSEIDMSDKTKSMKERFEKGEIYDDNDSKSTFKDEEMSVFEQGIGKQSRSLFLELDASAARSPIQQSPSSATLNRPTQRQNSQTVVSSDDIVRSGEKTDDIRIENADIVSKFKFFETYKPEKQEKKTFRITPPRDGVEKLPSPESDVYRDPLMARNDTEQDETLFLAERSHTTSKMLSMFRQMEGHKEQRPVGPKPLKRFTPPPDNDRRLTPNDDSGPEYSDSDEEEEECEEEEEEECEEELDPNYVKSSHKNVDEFLKAAQSAERAKQLREKFEKWEKNEIKKEMNSSSVNLYEPTTDIDEGQMETAKSLRARFEQMQQEEPKLANSRVKVNRFV